jgi:hypothetical protein
MVVTTSTKKLPKPPGAPKRDPMGRGAKAAQVNAMKMARGCDDCGYSRIPEALEFDHRPGTIKRGSISNMINSSWPWLGILYEIAKCDLVCANCHRERTVGRKQGVQVDASTQANPLGAGEGAVA